MRRFVCLLMICGLLFSLVGCGLSGGKATGVDEETLFASLSSSGDTAYFNGSYTTAAITDEASAVSSLQGISTLFGISEPQSELIPEASYAVNGCWYRLNQYYQGIPVYGRYITVMADPEGNAVGLVANTQDLSGCAVEPALTESQVRALLADTYTLAEGAAVLSYYTYGGSPQLCYRFDDGQSSLFISAENGTLVHETPLLDYESVAYRFGKNGENVANIDLTDSVYTMQDAQRDISIRSAVEEERETGKAFYGESDQITWDKKTNQEEETTDISALNAMQWIGQAYDYYADPETHGFVPAHNGVACPIIGFVHMKEAGTLENGQMQVRDYEDNAFYFGNGQEFYIAIGEKGATFQVICHEYTHGVIKRIAGFSAGQAQAINEACADVFSELIEAYTYGACDWESRDRSYSDPKERKEDYLDNYADYVDKVENTDEHYGGTIISHAAYLMNANCINYEDLGQLWFRTLLLCSAGTDMPTFCYIMNAVAGQMRDSGEFTEEQQEAVKEAFTAVGLMEAPAEFFTSVGESPQVMIYNSNGNLATNVLLEVEGMDISQAGVKTTKVESSQELVDPEAVQTELKAGAYKITVTGRYGGDRVVSYVVVRAEGTDDVEIQVPFKTKLTGTVYDAEAKVPLGKASVTVLSADGQKMYIVTTTNSRGEWVLYVPDDNYQVVWACDGYRSSSRELAVTQFPQRDQGDFDLGRTDLMPVLPVYLSACIGEYDGVTYCTYDVPNSDFVKLTVEAAEFDYISSFLFYDGKLYYCCKDAGTSDYRSALYRCNPDGTESEKLFGEGELDYTTSFHIADGILYPHGSNQYFNIAENEFVESEEYIYDFGALPDWYSVKYVFSQQHKSNTICRATYDAANPYQRSDWQDIAQLDNSWSRICGITSKALFYQTDKGNTANLYRYDFETESVSLVDSKPSAGSGGYFNW